MPGVRPPARSLLPGGLFVLAAAGLAFLGARLVGAQRAAEERTARERLQARAQEGAGLLVALASRLAGEAAAGRADAVLGPEGFLDPPERASPGRLLPVAGRDPEADFYLAEGERAEAVDGDPDRAAGLYGAAAGPERDLRGRLSALYRLAALERRRGAVGAARDHEAAFLALLPEGARSTVETLLVRARANPPDDALRDDLLQCLDSKYDTVIRGLLAGAGLGDPAGVAARRRDLALLDRLRPLVPRARAEPTGAALPGDRVAGWARAEDGTVRFREAAAPALPEGTEVLAPGAAAERAGFLSATAEAGDPLRGARVASHTPRAGVEAAARRSAWALAGALAALLLAGGAALVLVLRAARREAEAARERAAFVERVGHDLRTPVALIRMYAETLAGGRVKDPEEAREFAGIAAREAERLSGMVGAILDLSRVAEGNGSLARRPLDLAALAEEVAAFHRPLLERQGLRLEVRAPRPVPVRGDAASLRAAVSNLLENAARHAAAGGGVEVEVAGEGAAAEVRVLDRGPGVPAGMEEKVFERFVRGPGTAAPGAGLGLALVRETAEAHGGSARAEPREGGGARFVLRLPPEEGA